MSLSSPNTNRRDAELREILLDRQRGANELLVADGGPPEALFEQVPAQWITHIISERGVE